jgi:hypothetical protein
MADFRQQDFIISMPDGSFATPVPNLDTLVLGRLQQERIEELDGSLDFFLDYVGPLLVSTKEKKGLVYLYDQQRFWEYLSEHLKNPAASMALLNEKAMALGISDIFQPIERYGLEWLVLPTKKQLMALLGREKTKKVSVKEKYITIDGFVFGSEALDKIYDSKKINSMLDEMPAMSNNKDYVYAVFEFLKEQNIGDNVLFDNAGIMRHLKDKMYYSTANTLVKELVSAAKIQIHKHLTSVWYDIQNAALPGKEDAWSPAIKIKKHKQNEEGLYFGSAKLDQIYRLGISLDIPKDASNNEYFYSLFSYLIKQDLGKDVLVDKTSMIRASKGKMSYWDANKAIDNLVLDSDIKTYRVGNREWFLLDGCALKKT